MIALDLFCCQGGATRGYQQAGYRVVGIDIEDQPRYIGDEFWQADALAWVDQHMDWIRAEVSFIHASPPCQRYSRAQKIQQREHPDLIPPTRDLLNATGVPWVIENVEEARPELRDPVLLCGASFGMTTYRHRLFETGGWTLTAPDHPPHTAPLTKMGRPRRPGDFAHYVGNFSGVDEARADMQMPWASRDGLRECIPPAYARYVAEQHLAGHGPAPAAIPAACGA
ncbi:SAM-dependent methyltransferase [Streptomyces sp. CBG31]|uniref:SAM-dependent methyltransferase n=1 Tax=Streptomyces sp. CBG31 TaxID=2762623 RepID=UPI001EFD65A4|nr:SAM-dependent methyltransferase [Streptomyces sp. CBG31]